MWCETVPDSMTKYVTVHSPESDCNNCNFSNMEYKQSKCIWNQQLADFCQVSIIKYCSAHSHTVADDSRWHFIMLVISARHSSNAPQWKRRMKPFQMFGTISSALFEIKVKGMEQMRTCEVVDEYRKSLCSPFGGTCAKYIKLYISSLKKRKHKLLKSVGQVWSYIGYVFILSPAANAF